MDNTNNVSILKPKPMSTPVLMSLLIGILGTLLNLFGVIPNELFPDTPSPSAYKILLLILIILLSFLILSIYSYIHNIKYYKNQIADYEKLKKSLLNIPNQIKDSVLFQEEINKLTESNLDIKSKYNQIKNWNNKSTEYNLLDIGNGNKVRVHNSNNPNDKNNWFCDKCFENQKLKTVSYKDDVLGFHFSCNECKNSFRLPNKKGGSAYTFKVNI